MHCVYAPISVLSSPFGPRTQKKDDCSLNINHAWRKCSQHCVPYQIYIYYCDIHWKQDVWHHTWQSPGLDLAQALDAYNCFIWYDHDLSQWMRFCHWRFCSVFFKAKKCYILMVSIRMRRRSGLMRWHLIYLSNIGNKCCAVSAQSMELFCNIFLVFNRGDIF